MRQLLFSLFIVFLLITPREGQAGRAIPDDNLAYPVSIELSDDTGGSGFFLYSGTNVYLVTAAHVLFEPKDKITAKVATLISYSKDPKETGRNIFLLDLKTLLESKKIQKHSTEDVAIVTIANVVGKTDKGQDKLAPVSGVDFKENAPAGILSVDINNVKRFGDVLTANFIYVFGYPTSLGIKDVPQLDQYRPLLRFGIIAGTNPARRTIILDCPVYPGNSGGPVLEVEEKNFNERSFRVIGVITDFVPFEETWENKRYKYTNSTISNSGYAVAVSMDPVLELINSP
jgi:hypothetical protein